MAVKVTNKKPLFGNKRSHALNATRKKQGVKSSNCYFRRWY